jgi:hypothetical protein
VWLWLLLILGQRNEHRGGWEIGIQADELAPESGLDLAVTLGSYGGWTANLAGAGSVRQFGDLLQKLSQI